MKKIFIIILAGLFLSPSIVLAEDVIKDCSIEQALNNEKVKKALGTEVEFYFGGQSHGKVIKNFGTFRSNKKTNAFMKAKEQACQWAFASALKSLKQRAVKEGGNAVINIRSNYKDNETTSRETFKCGAGKAIAGVALIGEVVTIKK